MPAFSPQSEEKLFSCDPRLQRVLRDAVQVYDCTVQEGHREQAEQDAAFAAGTSKLKWPDGPHNGRPSRAADVVPYPLDWAIEKPAVRLRWLELAYAIKTAAERQGVRLRHGADWNRNGVFDDKFADWPHWELDD
jgi:hypothetical protein